MLKGSTLIVTDVEIYIYMMPNEDRRLMLSLDVSWGSEGRMTYPKDIESRGCKKEKMGFITQSQPLL